MYRLPLNLQIEPTTFCNLNCIWCSIKKSNKKNMTFEQFKSIIDQFPFLIIFKFAGVGEFFMNKDFFRMIEYLKKKLIFYPCFTSNFTMINNFERLSHIKTIFVSLDSSNKKSFEEIRKGADFDKVIGNIKKFQSFKNKPKLIIRAVISQSNKKELFGILGLAKEHNIKKIHFQKMYENDELKLDELEYKDYKKELIRQSEVKLKFSEFEKQPINKCLRALTTIFVSVEGYVLPCSLLTQRKDYFELIKKENFGNVFKQSIRKIWNNDKYTKFRKDIKKGIIPRICIRCPYYGIRDK